MSTASSASVRDALKIGLQANFVKRGLSQENIRSTTQPRRINSPYFVRQIYCQQSEVN